MTTFEKLVRDGIPDIIRAEGRRPEVRVLAEDAYLEALLSKLREEGEELRSAQPEHREEELADLLEVVRALIHLHGATMDDVLTRADAKAAERGGFAGRLFLTSVED